MTPEERIRANVQAALGKQTRKPTQKHNIFVKGVLKSALRTKNTDLAEIEEACAQLPVTSETCSAYTLICAHNNTQLREKLIEQGLEDPGLISAEQMSLATSQEFTATDFTLTIIELMACGVLSIQDGFYKVSLYADE